MSKLNSRAKGKVGELELSKVLGEFGWPARRGQQRSGVDQADVIDGPPGWHFEVKRTEKIQLWKAVEQANRDAPAGEVPVVVTRRNRSPWLAVVDLRTLLRLVRAAAGEPFAPLPASEPAPLPGVAPKRDRAKQKALAAFLA